MKNRIIRIGLAVALLLSPLVGRANEKGNGGDICEDRIKIIRDDIASWIDNGGASGLKLPQGLSLLEYKAKMLSEIGKAGISCTDNKVMVSGAEKTCENFVDSRDVPQIVCNREDFMNKTDQS